MTILRFRPAQRNLVPLRGKSHKTPNPGSKPWATFIGSLRDDLHDQHLSVLSDGRARQLSRYYASDRPFGDLKASGLRSAGNDVIRREGLFVDA